MKALGTGEEKQEITVARLVAFVNGHGEPRRFAVGPLQVAFGIYVEPEPRGPARPRKPAVEPVAFKWSAKSAAKRKAER